MVPAPRLLVECRKRKLIRGRFIVVLVCCVLLDNIHNNNNNNNSNNNNGQDHIYNAIIYGA